MRCGAEGVEGRTTGEQRGGRRGCREGRRIPWAPFRSREGDGANVRALYIPCHTLHICRCMYVHDVDLGHPSTARSLGRRRRSIHPSIESRGAPPARLPRPCRGGASRVERAPTPTPQRTRWLGGREGGRTEGGWVGQARARVRGQGRGGDGDAWGPGRAGGRAPRGAWPPYSTVVVHEH
eukprot:scaffold834_cov311-Prasinococcus_capsulatus_cf.AAC.12